MQLVTLYRLSCLRRGEDTRVMAIFQDNPGKPVPDCLQSGFYWH